MATAYIGIGSNVGDKAGNCRLAIEALKQAPGVLRVRGSSLYRTDPVGYTQQEEFVNCAAEIETGLSPQELLVLCKGIEQRLGRVRTFHWGPRVIDLDILLYEQAVIDDGDLQIPHPAMSSRRFVLAPLAELAPEMFHPVYGKTAAQMLNECDDNSGVIPL